MKQILILITVVMVIASCKSKQSAVTTNPAPAQERTADQRSARENGRTGQRPDRGEKKGPPSVDQVFKMDTNSDGRLSKSEVKGRLLEDFAKFDTDGDGFISKTEFENAPRPKKGQRPNN